MKFNPKHGMEIEIIIFKNFDKNNRITIFCR